MLLQDPLPWEYLLTLERGGLPEVSYSGVLSVWAGGHGNLMSLGNVEAPLWSRSLLKPFQLLAILPVLKDAYPMLTPEHYGVMMASQNGEPHQQALLKELMDLGCLKETDLQCPGCYPMAAHEKFKLKLENAPISPLYHPCSGKHIAQLLVYTALGRPFTSYLDPESFCFQSTLSLMSFLLGKEQELIPLSVDGCKMPNIALSASEMASLYCDLSQDLPEERKKGASPEVLNILTYWSEIRQWIHQSPTIFGGENRLDSRLIQPGYFKKDLNCIAKEGADGLLAL
ncbi:MAG: asparaginase, partial [Cyanobacteria bacterium]|nr:asparaginase [Cyanobacteriota bacterium]